jgi:hypothetical protein
MFQSGVFFGQFVRLIFHLKQTIFAPQIKHEGLKVLKKTISHICIVAELSKEQFNQGFT